MGYLDRAYAVLKDNRNLKSVEFILSKDFTIKVTRRFKPRKLPRVNLYKEDVVVTMGRPCYATRLAIKKNSSLSSISKSF